MDGRQYRQMLAELSKQIRPAEVNAMKFMCAEIIPKRRQEEIQTSLELWEALEERDELSSTNTAFLRELLQSSTDNRTDLINILNSYESCQRGTPTSPQSHSSHVVTHSNTNNIGKYNIFTIKLWTWEVHNSVVLKFRKGKLDIILRTKITISLYIVWRDPIKCKF